MTLLDADGFPIDLANGMLDNATGEFNLTVVMPTVLPSNGYEVAVDFNFEAMAPPGGAFYRVVDVSNATESSNASKRDCRNRIRVPSWRKN